MKIPETSANVAAYYGNEENGQWQTNGVTLEAGGGPAAGGDAGFLPLYPHPHAHAHPHPHPHQHPHPRAHHDPAYIMTGAYYPSAYQPLQPLPAHPHVHHAPVAPPPPPAAPDDFADYMWMENEEEFDKQVMQQLEEEALMEQCIEAMLEDERERAGDRRRPHANGHRNAAPNSSNGTTASLQEQVSKSKLNPLAAEFVPTGSRTAPPGAPEAAPPSPAERDGELPNEDETEEKPAKPPTPEVSAAGCDLLPAERTARHTDAHDDKQQEVSDTTEASAAPSESSESDTSLAKSISESKELPESARTSRAEPRKPKPKPASARPAVDAKKARDVRRQKHSSERPAEPRGEPERFGKRVRSPSAWYSRAVANAAAARKWASSSGEVAASAVAFRPVSEQHRRLVPLSIRYPIAA
ncbi:Polyadenylate-binding protein-interacting protein 2B [Eumeta japonica]|uniref:Polyadenylate-binding protein-interacting protein 2B n=1 Tax=Eumeta variegata TaxID=151549 RepID=A0A4C2A8V4_EUMVA|nr:Polyadenylate-binding protein-interacting protein 2B [Eumeta japonica]